jgi:hypothetical protein
VRGLLSLFVVVAFGLACAGVGARVDPVVAALKVDDFAKADELISARMQASPDDGLVNRLMGDLCLRRAQHFPRVWEKNQIRAIDSYRRAVDSEPTNCEYWNRLALAVAGGMDNPKTKFDPAEVAKLPMSEGHSACEGASILFFESYQQPTAAQRTSIIEKLGEGATAQAVHLKQFPTSLVSYNAAGLAELSWLQVGTIPSPQAGRWFVVTNPPQEAKGLTGARDRTIVDYSKFEVLRAPGSKVTFVDFGHGATLNTKGVIEASGCPGKVSWRVSSETGIPIGFCTKGPVLPGAKMYRADILSVADESHWAQQSMKAALLNPNGAREAQCVGGLVSRMLEYEASCAMTYRQAVSQERSFQRTQGQVAVDVDHADRILAAKHGEVLYGADVANELARGKVAKSLPYSLFLLTRSEPKSCTGRAITEGIAFSEDYSTTVARCTTNDFEFDFVGMALTGWRRGRE